MSAGKGRRARSPANALLLPTTARGELALKSAPLNELGKRSAEIAERFADGLAYDRERVVAEARFLMSQSAEAMLEAGKRLVQIKENEPFGEFICIVQDRLGLGERSARAMMQAAVKYLSPALESKRQTFAVLGKSKMFDLMVEADDALVELSDGGTLAGKTLDDMQAMSCREFQKVLADARQTIAAKDRVIAKRDAQLASYEEKAALPQDVATLTELQSGILTAQTALFQLGTLVQEIDARDVPEELRQVVLNDVEYLAQTFAEILRRGGIPVQFEEMCTPSWLKNISGARPKGG